MVTSPLPTAHAVLQADGLVKRYGSLTAVNGISLQVQAGACFGLLGPNGAGKSTTFRMVCCVSPVTAGTLTVLGMDVQRHPRTIKARLGVASQDNNLDPDLSVLENLLVYARYFDLPASVARSRAGQALDLFQLQDKRSVRVETLSGGMKRRLVLARALINQPDLLVLDEPTTGLDPQVRLLIWQQLRQLQSQGVTILISTHYMDEAAAICDRLAIMDHGRILDEGSPAALVKRHAGAEVVEVPLLGVAREAVAATLDGTGPAVQDVGDRLYLYGAAVRAMRERLEAAGIVTLLRPASLEDVFIRLTGAAIGGAAE